MVKRKLLSATYTSALAVIVLNIVEPAASWDDGAWLIGILIYSTYVVPVIFIYGIASSILSDKLSSKMKKYSNVLSLMLHLLFGIAFILPYGIFFESLPFLKMNIVDILINGLTISSSIFATIFFFIDRILKRRDK